MRTWLIKHRSGNVAFKTNSIVTAANRKEMDWIVSEVCKHCHGIGVYTSLRSKADGYNKHLKGSDCVAYQADCEVCNGTGELDF